MKTRYLFQWMQSNSINRKKRAIEKLTSICLQDESILENLLEELKKCIDEEAEEVRAIAYKAMYQLALKYEKIAGEIIRIYTTRFSDEGPLSKTIMISIIKKIIEKYPSRYDNEIKNLFRVAIDTDDINLKSIAIRSLSNIVALDVDFVLSNIEDVLAAVKSNNVNLIVSALEALKSIIVFMPDEKISDIQNSVKEALNNSSYLVRSHALMVLNVLIKEKKTVINESLIALIKKKLLDENIPVKVEALKTVFTIIDNNPNLIDEFLGAIVKECLLRQKNSTLKVIVLDYLSENIDKIPREILYRHNLPRILDIIDKNTVRKNEKLSKIKSLARTILEEKLGITYEMRKNL